jgi:hypothetical protein
MGKITINIGKPGDFSEDAIQDVMKKIRTDLPEGIELVYDGPLTAKYGPGEAGLINWDLVKAYFDAVPEPLRSILIARLCEEFYKLFINILKDVVCRRGPQVLDIRDESGKHLGGTVVTDANQESPKTLIEYEKEVNSPKDKSAPNEKKE